MKSELISFPKAQALLLLLTLHEIARTGCTSYTTGSCFAVGRDINPISRFGAYRCCDACLAQAALDNLEIE